MSVVLGTAVCVLSVCVIVVTWSLHELRGMYLRKCVDDATKDKAVFEWYLSLARRIEAVRAEGAARGPSA